MPRAPQYDLSYSALHAERTFDFYPTCKANPVVVYLHGGGWWKGDKNLSPEMAVVVDGLRERGYNVIAANYRLTNDGQLPPQNRWPAQINDVKCLFNFLAAHPKYGDTSRLSGWGHSAGSQLALVAMYTDPSTFYADCDWSGTYQLDRVAVTSAPIDLTRWTPGAIQPTIGLVGVDPSASPGPMQTQALLAASPIHYASATSPPTLMLTGVNDTLITPSDNSGELQAAFAALGRSDVWTSYPGADHNTVYDPSLTTAQVDIPDFFPIMPESKAANEAGCPPAY